MDVKQYIESGILEQYALGMLTESERVETERLIRQYPELKSELEKIEISLENLAQENKMKSPEGLFGKIMSAVDDADNKETKVISISASKKSNTLNSYLAIAASVALLVSLGLNYHYYNKWQNTNTKLVAEQQDKNLIVDQYQTLQTSFDVMKNDMGFMMNPNTVAVHMKGAGDESMMATVYWNPNTSETYVSVNNMPQPDNGMHYVLWALKDGQPVNIGSFPADSSMMRVTDTKAADTFAVTMEKTADVAAPDLSQLKVIGNV